MHGTDPNASDEDLQPNREAIALEALDFKTSHFRVGSFLTRMNELLWLMKHRGYEDWKLHENDEIDFVSSSPGGRSSPLLMEKRNPSSPPCTAMPPGAQRYF